MELKKDLSAEEICRIIEACKLAGVQEIKTSGLSLSFLPPQTEVIVSSQTPITLDLPPSSESETPLETKTEKSTVDLMNEDSLDEAEEAQVMIDDPYSFEQMQIRRDIERNRLNAKT